MGMALYSSIHLPHSQITFLQVNVIWLPPYSYVFKVGASSDILSSNSVCIFQNTLLQF